MEEVLEQHIVPKLKERVRISNYAFQIFQQIQTKKALKKALKRGEILINNKQAFSGDYVVGGEVISIIQIINEDRTFIFEKKIDVLFEDEHIAAVLKPAGISTVSRGRYNLQNTLVYNLQKSLIADAMATPHVCHRLDYATSGIVLVGKTRSAVIHLNNQFREKQIQKYYYAVTLGEMKTAYNIDSPIDNKPSSTHITKLVALSSDKFGSINLVRAIPLTGRTHQIRKHLSSIGFPICGDKIYNKNSIDIKGKGMYLHAQAIKFTHPLTNDKIEIKTELPKKYIRLFGQIDVS